MKIQHDQEIVCKNIHPVCLCLGDTPTTLMAACSTALNPLMPKTAKNGLAEAHKPLS